MEGFVTLDEVGDEEDLDHQKRKAGITLAAKTEGSITETQTVNAEEGQQENEALENGAKNENLKSESSEVTDSTLSEEQDKKENTEGQESDENRIGPYQPSVPVGKNALSSSNVTCVVNGPQERDFLS